MTQASATIGAKPSDSTMLSTSFGAAGSALSLSSSVPASSLAAKNQRGQSVAPMTVAKGRGAVAGTGGGMPSSNQENNSTHSHLGVLCNLASSPTDSADTILSQSLGSRSMNGGFGNGIKRTSSILTAEDDDDGLLDGSAAGLKGHKGEIHKCETCSKVYRHPSCLVKHRWEHTIHWRESSKLSGSKHQTVQLLEAAAILVGMESPARSLPEEKALWPAAVSPPSSGLLGSDKVNFVKLMSSKMAFNLIRPDQNQQFISMNQQQLASQQQLNTNNNNNASLGEARDGDAEDALSPLSTTSELSRSIPSAASASSMMNQESSSFGSATPTFSPGSFSLSPLNGMSTLMLGSPPTRAHDPRAAVAAAAASSTVGNTMPMGRTRAASSTSANGRYHHHHHHHQSVRTAVPGGMAPNANGRPAAVTTASAKGGRASKKAAKVIDSGLPAGHEVGRNGGALLLDRMASKSNGAVAANAAASATAPGHPASHAPTRGSGAAAAGARRLRRGSSPGKGGGGVVDEVEDANADVHVLHLDWDSSSHSDRTESDDRLTLSPSSRRSGSAETEGTSEVGLVFGEEEEEEEEEEEDLMEGQRGRTRTRGLVGRAGKGAIGEDHDDEDEEDEDEDEEDSSRSFGDADGMDAMEMEGVE